MQDFAFHALKGARPIGPIGPQILSDPLSCLTTEDRKKFNDFGWGTQLQPRHNTITAAIRHHLRSQPEAIAIECAGTKLTYGELDIASNRLASVLKACGVKRGDAVCLYLHRSAEMVIGIVAAMKLGAAYVPQHVGVAPEKGLRHIANVTDAKVLLTLSNLAHKVPAEPHQTLITIDEVTKDASLDGTALDLISHRAEPDDLAMILFTSGTTGVPNGVQVTHRNLANVLLTAPGDLSMRPGLRVGQILSIAFDMAAWEIWARCPTEQL